MTTCSPTGRARTAAVGLCALLAAFAVLVSARVIEPTLAARLVGIAFGIVMIVALALLKKRRAPGAVRTAVVGFLTLAALTGTIAQLGAAHVIGVTATARGLGVVVGAMAIFAGNFFPKTRPLEIIAGRSGPTRAAERAIGWILVLAGAAFVALFTFAPLERAKALAAAAGVGALLLIAAICVRLAANRLRSAGSAVTHGDKIERSDECARRSRPMLALLVSVLYMLATACTQYLFAGQPLGHAITLSLTTVSACATVVWAILTWRRRSRAQPVVIPVQPPRTARGENVRPTARPP